MSNTSVDSSTFAGATGLEAVTPLDKKRSLLENRKGKFRIEFDQPKLASPIRITAYKDSNGKLVKYLNANNEEEAIVIDPPTYELDLSVDENVRKAAFIRNYNIKKRFGSRVTITDTEQRATANIAQTRNEFDLIGKVRDYVKSPLKLQDFALNLGIDVMNMSASNVESEVYDMVKLNPLNKGVYNPSKVEAVLNDPDFEYIATILHASKTINKTVEEKLGAYYYGQIYMGGNLKQTVIYCRENALVYESIKKETDRQ